MSIDDARTKIIKRGINMPDTKYCYPDTDVLINKLDIRDLDKLHIFERKLTMLRLLELLDKPINGKFDFKHFAGYSCLYFPGCV